MSGDTIVAKRYARALFEVAQSQNIIAQVEQDLRLVVGAVQDHPDFRKLLEHPNLGAAEKTNVLAGVFQGKIADATFQTLKLLVNNRRESILSNLLNDYVQIANEALGQALAVVTTPLPLTEAEAKDIIARFSQITGKTIRVENRVDASLLGGMQVRIGDRLYDGSLSGKLKRLEQNLNVSRAL